MLSKFIDFAIKPRVDSVTDHWWCNGWVYGSFFEAFVRLLRLNWLRLLQMKIVAVFLISKVLFCIYLASVLPKRGCITSGFVLFGVTIPISANEEAWWMSSWFRNIFLWCDSVQALSTQYFLWRVTVIHDLSNYMLQRILHSEYVVFGTVLCAGGWRIRLVFLVILFFVSTSVALAVDI